MKIRTDFVTNSSSSSFILGFKDEQDMENEIRKYAPINYISQIYSDAERNIISKDEALSIFKDVIRWEAYWEVTESFPSRKEFKEFRETQKDELEKLIEEKEKTLIEEFTAKISNLNFFALVNYDDHVNGELEHIIMPQMPFTVYRLNEH